MSLSPLEGMSQKHRKFISLEIKKDTAKRLEDFSDEETQHVNFDCRRTRGKGDGEFCK